jgi:hypothetical protein
LAGWRRARSPSDKLAAIQVLVDRALDDGLPDVLRSAKGVDLFVAGILDQLADRRPEDIVA